MSYVLTDGNIDGDITYPYSVGLLRRDNPNISFPSQMNDAELATFNVFPVTPVNPPSYNVITQNIVETNPMQVSNGWVQTWAVTSASEQEITDRTAAYEAAADAEALRRLTDSDRFVVEAFELSKTLTPNFLSYRASLRTPSELEGYPVSPQWPGMPESVFGQD
jgi:hypothetical protein